ncbi:MAG: carbohydrate ABC transporter permease [Nitriliruptorales bacterium]
MRRRRTTVLLYTGATALSLVWLVPLMSAVMISLRPLDESRQGWWRLGEATFTFGNYVRAWREGLGAFALNSFVITLGSVALTVLLGAVAAYAFIRMRFRGRDLAYFLLITTMIVPLQLILIPLLPWFRTLGLDRGAWQLLGIVLVHTAFGAGWAVFMVGGFMAEVPQETIEAAHIDGASHWQVFRRVVAPLAVPGIVSFAIIDFIFVWNDLLLALTLLDRAFQPIQVGLANLQSPHLSQQDLVSAGAMIAILPPIALFATLNRYYVRGLFAGGGK